MISCSRWVSLRLFLPSPEIFLPCKGCPLCSTETSAVRQNRAHLDDFSFSPNFRSKEVPIFQKSGNYWVTEGVSFTYKKLVFPGLPELSSSHVLSIASFLFKRKGALAWAPCFWQVLYPFGGLLVSHSVVSISLQSHGLQHSRLPCPLLSPRVGSDSCPLSWWCHPTISSSVIPVSFRLQSFPASGSFPMSQLFTSGGQSIGVLTSVLPMNIQGWFPLGLTGWISLLSKGLSRVFPSTTIQKHQFFSAQPSLWSNSHIHTWLLEKP